MNAKSKQSDNSTNGENIFPEEIATILKQKDREIAVRDDLLREVYAEVRQLRSQVHKLQDDLKNDPFQKAYKQASSWVSKIVFTIRQENRPLRSSELINLLERKERYLATHPNKVQYFSAFLTQAVRYKRICPYKLKGVRGYYYLLPEWMETEKKVNESYNGLIL
ncbi:MAG: hypothetical protein E6Q24_06105 [Chitinophagaceae bacterium]|nr:MAG: hypothetical protein E6Q24_06105 [Chitinophagaceae bacterium]